MSYAIIQRRANTYATGLKTPKKRVCSAKPLPVQKFSSDDIRGMLCDSDRLAARDQFGPEFCIDQGPLGQCNGVAACSALQRAFIRNGLKDCPRLSSNWLYAQINGGRDNGSMLDDGMKQLQLGVPRWKPGHERKYKKREFTKSDNDAAGEFRSLECYGVETETELATGLALGFTAVVAVHVTNSWFKMNSKNIVNESNGVGNHAVVIDDCSIDEKTGAFLFDHVGSWGPNLHDHGRAFLTWDDHLSGPISNHFFYLVRATRLDDYPKGVK